MQTAVTAYVKSKQLQLFAFARQYCAQQCLTFFVKALTKL